MLAELNTNSTEANIAQANRVSIYIFADLEKELKVLLACTTIVCVFVCDFRHLSASLVVCKSNLVSNCVSQVKLETRN